ncbi:glycosyltransferase family 4 protein [Patescibacteria group bacterium]|nr:glycosyltransferase family 4 protein [Patescibacteria group bacterium]
MNQKKINLAIDANEANTIDRVGSNIYAFEILKAIEKLTQQDPDYHICVFLSSQPVADLPTPRAGFEYKVIGPQFLWTQFGEPIHLFLNKDQYDVFFTPGHYAPRCCPIPYVSSVMDLAFLKYPDQFQQSDLIQLKHWTSYSVKHANKVIAISSFTKADVVKTYHKNETDVVVAPPAVAEISPATTAQAKEFFKRHHIRRPYFLFIGTFQPRKNLLILVEAYEKFCRRLSSQNFGKNKRQKLLPQLVLAGKIGWLTDPIINRIKASPFLDQIILPGFVKDEIKPILYQDAVASLLVGLYEGFGIPPLESLQYGCLPIVSNVSSLPEAVGEEGILVDPKNVNDINQAMETAYQQTAKTKAIYRKKGKEQLTRFSWEKSAQIILNTIKSIIHEKA